MKFSIIRNFERFITERIAIFGHLNILDSDSFSYGEVKCFKRVLHACRLLPLPTESDPNA